MRACSILFCFVSLANFANAQIIEIDFNKVVAIYADAAKATLWTNYNIENEKDASSVKAKKRLYQKDTEAVDAIVKSTSDKYIKRELPFEQSIDSLKKELTSKFPALNDCFYSSKVQKKLALELAKKNEEKAGN